MILAEAVGYPHIATLFYESGPATIKRAIGSVLERLVECGELEISDIDYAAWQLSNMALGRGWEFPKPAGVRYH